MITRAWLAWKRVAQGIGTFRARGVLTSYFVVMLRVLPAKLRN